MAYTSAPLSGVGGMSYRVISSGVIISVVDFSKCSEIEDLPGNCWFCCLLHLFCEENLNLAVMEIENV